MLCIAKSFLHMVALSKLIWYILLNSILKPFFIQILPEHTVVYCLDDLGNQSCVPIIFVVVVITGLLLILSTFKVQQELHWFPVETLGGFICSFSLLSLSITLRTSKFRNQFTISLKYFDMACYLKREAYSGPISFEVQRNDW